MKMIFGAQSFGQRLQVLRQVHNLNQQELAEIADVSQATISKLENDKVESPAFEEVHRLMAGLEIPDAAAFEIFSGGRSSSRENRFHATIKYSASRTLPRLRAQKRDPLARRGR
jgi:transcriptional regulator with XRE-family HTH domain